MVSLINSFILWIVLFILGSVTLGFGKDSEFDLEDFVRLYPKITIGCLRILAICFLEYAITVVILLIIPGAFWLKILFGLVSLTWLFESLVTFYISLPNKIKEVKSSKTPISFGTRLYFIFVLAVTVYAVLYVELNQ